MAVQGAVASRSGLRSALPLLAPAYLWLTVAIFLPLSAMVFFSFMTDLPLSGKPWAFTLGNYAAFFSQSLYLTLLLASLRLGLDVTLWCILIGYPAAYVVIAIPAFACGVWLTLQRRSSVEAPGEGAAKANGRDDEADPGELGQRSHRRPD